MTFLVLGMILLKFCACEVAAEVGLHAPIMADWWQTDERLMPDRHPDDDCAMTDKSLSEDRLAAE